LPAGVGYGPFISASCSRMQLLQPASFLCRSSLS